MAARGERSSGHTPSETWPEPSELAEHLRLAHYVPAEILAAHEPDEHLTWHQGEHRWRHPAAREATHSGHLRHRHAKAETASQPKKKAA